MIPIRLELRNFLPYRAPDPLRFDGIHLACLTGPNGAGKSSILDAITWALWGKARANRDEELIHQGQDDMHVQLDFVQEGLTFRVLRKRSRAKRSSTGTLDLFRLNDEGQWKLDNEPSMRATQTRINALLRLDYETFVHSAFLQQGKADAFTTQTAAERKRILSEILGLAQWAEYEELAKQALNKVKGQIETCDLRIREIDAALAREPALRVELAQAQESHREALAAYEEAKARENELKGADAELKAALGREHDLRTALESYGRDLEEVEPVIARQSQQVAEYEAVIAMTPEIEAGFTALQEARQVDEALGDKLQALRGLDELRAELRSALSAARAAMETEIEGLTRAIAESQALIDAEPSADLEVLSEEIRLLQGQEAARADLLQQETMLKERRAELATTMKVVEAEGKARRGRVETLGATDAPICPLCGQVLTEEHRAQVIADLTIEITQMRDQYAAARADHKAIDVQLGTLAEGLRALEADLKRLPALNERVGKLAAQMDAAQGAALRLDTDSERVGHLRDALAAERFAPDVRAALAELDAQQSELAYDEGTHNSARQSLKTYQRYEQLWSRLEMAHESLPKWAELLAGSQARKTRLEVSIAEKNAQIEGMAAELAMLQAQSEEYRRREVESRAQHTLYLNAFERMNKVQQTLLALGEQRSYREVLGAKLEALRYDEGLLNELKDAFGKKGVPAMIIETAIPELEATANALLARMTDGRMHVRLITQREKITGGQSETLEIEISDELGTRNYELYSGGEAFRINFALRVALSQLLARRAGAHLRTLFIDEGFGTQDDSGRDKLVEAITAIQDDFDLILVITHIDELRDSFPVHVMVDKTASGSRISVR
jgi:exonuclease SbcC